MGTIHRPQPVKLMASLLSGELLLLEKAKAALRNLAGEIDLESELLPFDHTDYYAAELGPAPVRQIVTFRELADPATLPAVKRLTNQVEQVLAEGGRRRVNVDPGYLSLGKLVLASTKDHAHRLYLDDGIYAEVTLTFQRGRFRPWPWTYPDYASERYCELFGQIREGYKAQLRADQG